MNSEDENEDTEVVPTDSEAEDLESSLVDESDVHGSEEESGDSFDKQLEQTLKETEAAVLGLQLVNADPDASKLWTTASEVVRNFRPVPWFIWRISNFVLGRPAHIGKVSEGLVFGLRRLLFAVASDPVLGAGEKINSARKALSTVSDDTIAAAAVMHAICRKLARKEHERIWKPILDDALIRAQLGYYVGRRCDAFGGGRGMLAGFSGRAGLTVLIATGEIESARRALELLATGKSIRETGLLVYECDPLQVSAMLLTASGIGRDAAFGTVSFSLDPLHPPEAGDQQKQWFYAFQIVEFVRMNEPEKVPEEAWQAMNISDEEREKIVEAAKRVVRRGHGWQWIIG